MINIKDELTADFLTYAQEVNQNRSFPDVRDGIKPSQRAALWEMFEKGYSSDKPHVKSAKVVGGIIGSYWPHGDGSAYESIVRMSQSWVNNIPFVNFHGGNGSLLGGPDAASMRYTECRLAKASEDGMFSNIRKDTVDFIPNFSEDLEWPKVLPAIVPALFVNGSQGIGYTIAQEWEPGNLKEITGKIKDYLATGEINCDNIYPDYPTGGIIINKKDISKIYETGKGSVVLRGKTEIIDNIIKITELPYQVYAEDLIASIKELANKGTLPDVNDIFNKSDDTGMLIEIECEKDPEVTLAKLFKLTNLQCTFSANQMALLNGAPEMFTLKKYVEVYVKHNLDCLLREYKFTLAKAEKRNNILAGLVKALENIDAVIACIKSSKSSADAKVSLMKQFTLDQEQVQAILDMRLNKLAHIESVDLYKEKAELEKLIAKCNKIISSEKLLKSEFSSRLDDFVARYSWERKTEVIDVDLQAEKVTVKKEKVADECFIILTDNNCIKRITPAEYKPQKSIDKITHAVKVLTTDRVVLLSASGLMYKMPVNKIPKCNMNSAGASLPERMVALYSGNEDKKYIFMLADSGRAKKIETATVFGIGKLAGAPIVKLENELITSYTLVNDDKITVNFKGKEVTIDTTKYKSKGRSAGCIACVKTK